MAKIALAVGVAAAAVGLELVTGGAGGFGTMALLKVGEAAAFGASMGLAVGGMLFRPQIPGSMPLQDRQVSSSADGAPIAFGYGRGRFAGQVIWSPGITYHTVGDSSSKGGGPGVGLSYYYMASIAAAFGEGPATVEKIWADSKLIYDGGATFGTFSPWDAGTQYNPDDLVSYQFLPTGLTDAITAIFQCVIANQGVEPAGNSLYWELTSYAYWDPTIQYYPGNQVAYPPAKGQLYAPTSGQIYTCVNPNLNVTPAPAGDWNTMQEYYATPTLYPGDEAQLPDPTIQANNGVDATPAFRGLCYAVWENMPLATFGNRVPNLRAQVNFTKVIRSGYSSPLLGDVVQDLCVRGGLSASQVDVSELLPPVPPWSNGSQTQTVTAAENGQILVLVVGTDSALALNSVWVTSSPPLTWNRMFNAIDHWYFGNQYLSVMALIAQASDAGDYEISAPVATAFWSIGLQNLEDLVGGLIGTSIVEGDVSNFEYGQDVTISKSITVDQSSLVVAICTMSNPKSLEINLVGGNLGNLQTFIVDSRDAFASAYAFGGPGTYTAVFQTPEQGNDLASNMNVVMFGFPTAPGESVVPPMPDVFPTGNIFGYVLERNITAAAAIKELMLPYFFGGCESDGTMRFVPRNFLTGAPSAPFTIVEGDLGLAQDHSKLEETFAQDQDLPLAVTTLYNDIALNWQQGKQIKQRSQRVVSTRQQQILSMPLSFSDDDARQIAEATLYSAWQARQSFSMNFWKALYMLLDPTDIVYLTYEGQTFEIRVTQNTLGKDFCVALKAVSEDVRNYSSVVEGAVNQGFLPAAPVLAAQTFLFLLDLPLLRDVDSNPSGSGFYAALGSNSTQWPGAVLEQSSDDANFTQIDSDAISASFGNALNALAAPVTPWTWDTVSTLNIRLVSGSLAGASDLSVLNGANALIVGKEVIQFGDAVQNSDGSWTVSRLLRGRRGTEVWCGSHAVGETVIQPLAGGVLREAAPLAQIGKLLYYRGVTVGQNVSSASDVDLTLAGYDLYPYAVASLGGAVDGSGNWQIAWLRRTRIGGALPAGWGTVPLSEESEAYQIDILNGSTVIRTLSVTSPTATYAEADQVTDFGSAQSSLSINVYQISASVGRGFKATATLPLVTPAVTGL